MKGYNLKYCRKNRLTSKRPGRWTVAVDRVGFHRKLFVFFTCPECGQISRLNVRFGWGVGEGSGLFDCLSCKNCRAKIPLFLEKFRSRWDAEEDKVGAERFRRQQKKEREKWKAKEKREREREKERRKKRGDKPKAPAVVDGRVRGVLSPWTPRGAGVYVIHVPDMREGVHASEHSGSKDMPFVLRRKRAMSKMR